MHTPDLALSHLSMAPHGSIHAMLMCSVVVAGW